MSEEDDLLDRLLGLVFLCCFVVAGGGVMIAVVKALGLI